MWFCTNTLLEHKYLWLHKCSWKEKGQEEGGSRDNWEHWVRELGMLTGVDIQS